jgi:hypothetical protein
VEENRTLNYNFEDYYFTFKLPPTRGSAKYQLFLYQLNNYKRKPMRQLLFLI